VRWPPAWELIIWSYESALGYLPAGTDMSTIDEESQSVGSVIRQRLLETITD
jgi:hypothetical protein